MINLVLKQRNFNSPLANQPTPQSLGYLLASAAVLFFSPLTSLADANQSDCTSTSDRQYLCGIPSAEDLVRLSDTSLLLASVFAPGPGMLNVIDTKTTSWHSVYPTDLTTGAASNAYDTSRFPDCPGAPEPAAMISHGLFITEETDKHSTLYAVSHGARETIEVFDVHRPDQSALPVVTWIGCVPTPEGQEANSVAVLEDGSLLATIPVEHGFTFAQSMEGIATGAVHHWDSTTNDWQRLDATAQPYPNGVEIGTGEQSFYIASSGLRKIIEYSLDPSNRVLRESSEMTIIPDNLHSDRKGNLFTGGLLFDYPECVVFDAQGNFSLELFGACARPYEVLSYDPIRLQPTKLASGAADASFTNVTMGVEVNGAVWVGTFAGDRVEYVSTATANGED